MWMVVCICIESRKKRGTKVYLLCMLSAWHEQSPQFEISGAFMTTFLIVNATSILLAGQSLSTLLTHRPGKMLCLCIPTLTCH